MDSWSESDKGLVRKENEDALITYCDDEKKLALFVLCDGMGGARAGGTASRLAADVYVNAVRTSVTAESGREEIIAAMTDALKQANDAVFRRSTLEPDCRGMGTTLVSFLATRDSAVVINVGDSRAYFLNSYGIRQITRDHSVIEDMINRGTITRDQSKYTPGKNLITRAVGTLPEVEGDVFPLEVKEGEFVFLCSDGLSNTVSDQEILFETLHGSDTGSCCKRLLSLAIERGAPDNVSMVLFRK